MKDGNRNTCGRVSPERVRQYSAMPGASLPQTPPELTGMLRWVGGIVLVIAAIAFMVQGVYSLTPMTRHWLMLTICALLGVLGVACGTLLDDEKGARAFLGLSAASFPVLASQLGAMFFSLFGHPPPGMPQPLLFSAMASSKVMAAACLTLAVILPVSYLAFRILARSRAALLTGVFTMANLTLLIPVRQGLWLGVLISAVAGLLCLFDSRFFGKDFRLESFEGRAARIMLVGPLAVLLGRSLFYPVGSGFYGLMLALAGAYLAFYWGRSAGSTIAKGLCQMIGFSGLAGGWLISLFSYPGVFSMDQGTMIYLMLLPIAAVLVMQSLICDGPLSAYYQHAGAVIALLAVAVAHWLSASPAVSLIGAVSAGALVLTGTLAGERSICLLGLLMAFISLGNFGLQMFRLHGSFAWAALALIGIAVMFSASLIEKRPGAGLFKNNFLWGRLKIR